MSNVNDSHQSIPSKNNEKSPIGQHHRMALGEKVTGASNPYGAAKPSTEDKCNGRNY